MSDAKEKNRKARRQSGAAAAASSAGLDSGGPEIIEIPPDPQALAAALAEAGANSQAAAADDATAPAAALAPADSAAPHDDEAMEEYNVPKVKDLAEARCILEALLFTTIEPLPLKQLSALLPPLDPQTIRKLIVELQSDYDARRRGLQIMEVGKGFQMASRPEYGKWVLGLLPHRRKSALSTAALETLAIIAYKQPITRVEVDQIRGVDSSGTVRNLLDLGLIKAAGQKEAAGRPMLYVTTDHFLKVFGLRRLTDMPTLQELRRRYMSGPTEKLDGAAEGESGDDAGQPSLFEGLELAPDAAATAPSEFQQEGAGDEPTPAPSPEG